MDTINSPEWYRAGGIEAIEVAEAFFPNNPYLWDAFIYLARAGKKTIEPLEDLKKAQYYISRLIDKLENEPIDFAIDFEGAAWQTHTS